MSWTTDVPSTEEVLSSLFTSALPPLPPQESHVGPVLATWWETEPGVVYVHAEGGTPDDRHYASVITRIQLEGHGYRHAQFELDASAAPEPPNYRKATGPERCGGCKMFDHGECWGYGNKQVNRDYVCDSFAAGRSSSVRTASWVDIMNKAKRLISSGQVQLLRNGFNYIVGHVVGDHGSYETELSRDDPNSRAITSWQCTCPWDQYAWQRTRKWKRLEGRPCAHVLGLYWKALSTPLDDDVTPEQKEQMGTGQKRTPDAPPVPEHPPEIEDRLQKGEEAPKAEGLPRSFSPEGEIIQGDQGQLPGMPPDATGGPPGPAQAPLAPPPSGPAPPGILPPFPGAQQEMPWGGPGTTPGGMKSPPGAYTVPGAKPQTPANPIQNPSTYSSVRMAAKTRTQKLQEKQRFEQEFGPDQAPIFHRFPDGWSLRKLHTPHAEAYEGELQPNCLGSAKSLRQYVDGAEYHRPNDGYSPMASLRDPDNLPHATFEHPTEGDDPPKHYYEMDIEGGNGSNPGKYAPYIHDYVTQQLGWPPVSPEDWEQTYGMPMSHVGDSLHQAEPEDYFREYRPGGFWNDPTLSQGDPEFGGRPHLVRAVKPIQKAWKRIEDGEPLDTVLEDLKERLLHNYSVEQVGNILDDVKREHERWKQFQPYSEKEMEPPGRVEFPEFYWMHHQYGAEAMDAVNQANNGYRHFHWNTPHMAMNMLDSHLQNVDLLPSDKDGIRNAFWDAHARAFAQRSGMQYEPTDKTFSVPQSPEERYYSLIQDKIQQANELGAPITPEYMQKLIQQAAQQAGLKTAAQFNAPQPVRAKKPLMVMAEGPVPGQHGDGDYREIPAGTPGEVFHQDPSTGWIEVAFDLPASGPNEPYRVRVYAEPGDIEAAGDLTPSDPAIRRKTHAPA